MGKIHVIIFIILFVVLMIVIFNASVTNRFYDTGELTSSVSDFDISSGGGWGPDLCTIEFEDGTKISHKGTPCTQLEVGIKLRIWENSLGKKDYVRESYER